MLQYHVAADPATVRRRTGGKVSVEEEGSWMWPVAPPRGAAGAPPRPPCREGSWISRRRKRAGEVRCARRVRPLSPPRTRLATALAAKDGRETSILSTLRSRSTSRDSGPEADYPHPGSTAGEPAPSRAFPAWARLASGTRLIQLPISVRVRVIIRRSRRSVICLRRPRSSILFNKAIRAFQRLPSPPS